MRQRADYCVVTVRFGVWFMAALGALALSCGSDAAPASVVDSGGADADVGTTGTSVAGTVTLPAAITGRCVMIAIDDDTTGSNGSARRADGSYLLTYMVVTGTSVSFSFDRVPAGSYFLWAFVDADASSSKPPSDCEITGGPGSGDHLGYYGTGLTPPAGANVSVPAAGGAKFDFKLGVFP